MIKLSMYYNKKNQHNDKTQRTSRVPAGSRGGLTPENSVTAKTTAPISEIPIAVANLEIPELTRDRLLRDPVSLLDPAGALLALGGDRSRHVIGQPAPLFFHFPAELFPDAFETIPVQVDLLGCDSLQRQLSAW
jgi:hypothetical protein